MSEADLQSLAKVTPQVDPIVERTIRAVLGAAYGTGQDPDRALVAGPAIESGGDVCAICEAPGIRWKGLTPCSYGGKSFHAHPRCFAALTAVTAGA